MANDPGLAGDSCFYMEAVAGDGGTHNSNGVWWLSPDIKLTGPTSGPDKADPGQSNTVDVTFHRKAADSNCVTSGDESANVELWVGNPSLAMSPNNNASTRKIDLSPSILPAEGASVTHTVNWTPPSGVPATDPESPGHKCLIARCYPSSLTPSANNFFVPDDPHVAQRNICIVPCGGPGAARLPRPCGFNVTTANLNLKESEKVTLRAVADLRPDKFVRDVVMESLRGTPGFKRLATVRPRGFKFELPDFPDARVNDQTKPGCLGSLFSGARPAYEAIVELEANQLTNFTFVADISRAGFGVAHIFHLTQIGADQRVQGGLTIVMMSV